MFRRSNKNTSGFTLIELAIVLGIAGVLIGGVWRLLAAGNQQTRDQALANQHAQLISAINTYLQSEEGMAYLTGIDATPRVFALSSANCGIPANRPSANFCSFLPASFNFVNAYNQTYSLAIKKDGTGAGNAPRSYYFMLLTSGGEVIPDTSGGRISASIGGDGGFIFSTNVCGAVPTYACGAYGTWTARLSDYGLTGTIGRVASLTTYSSSFSSMTPWLARQRIDWDSTPPIMNTMTVPLYLGGATTNDSWLSTRGRSIFMNDNVAGLITGGGTITMQGGLMDVNGTTRISGALTEGGGLSGMIDITKDMTAYTNPAIRVDSGGCIAEACSPVLSVFGNQSVSATLTANGLHALTFIYNSSDVSLKKDIAPLTGSIEKIMKLKPVSYVLKANDAKTMGFIAQDLEKVYPEFVATMRGGTKAITYDALFAPIIDTVQQLKKENDELRTQLQEQNARLKALEEGRK